MPCGRVYFFTELNPHDLAMKTRVRETMLREKEELDKFSSYEHSGRKRKVWCKNTYSKFVTLLTEKLVNHLMESDRIKTREGRFWAIVAKDIIDRKYANWETNGMKMAVSIQGIPGDYRITLSSKRGVELRDRIKKGQKFHEHVTV